MDFVEGKAKGHWLIGQMNGVIFTTLFKKQFHVEWATGINSSKGEMSLRLGTSENPKATQLN